MLYASENPRLCLHGEQLAALKLVNPTLGQKVVFTVEAEIYGMSNYDDKITVDFEIEKVITGKSDAEDQVRKMFPSMKS